jgi:pilus assembly protein Flp/PilA
MLKRRLKEFWRDEAGQTTTEYILIIAVVMMIAMKFKSTIGNRIQGASDSIGTKMDSFLNE